MPLDPALLKLRWGVTDPALDPLVAQVAEQAQALCETYCGGRRFDLAEDAEDFQPVSYSFQVRRFPIVRITGLWAWQRGQMPVDPVAGPGIATYQLDREAGLVRPGGWFGGQTIHCAYEGGFDPWPADLIWAVTAAADIVWGDTPGGGAPAGEPGSVALGPVKRLSVVGVFSAELGEADSSGGDGDNTWGILPPGVTAVLDRYALAATVGIG